MLDYAINTLHANQMHTSTPSDAASYALLKRHTSAFRSAVAHHTQSGNLAPGREASINRIRTEWPVSLRACSPLARAVPQVSTASTVAVARAPARPHGSPSHGKRHALLDNYRRRRLLASSVPRYFSSRRTEAIQVNLSTPAALGRSARPGRCLTPDRWASRVPFSLTSATGH